MHQSVDIVRAEDIPIHILLLEDNIADAELVQRELRQAGLRFLVCWTQDKASFAAALETATPDLVLADYSLPGFDGLTALSLVRQRWADVPVIIVSGAIGEELAIDALKAGATDYVLKHRLSRLGPVVRRALVEARDRAEKRRAEEALREAKATLELKVAQRTAQLQQRAWQLQKLTLELAQAEERERRRIALLLHEDLQQQIAGAKFHLNLLKGRNNHDARELVEKIDAMLKEAIEKSRRLSHDLSPSVLHANDLAEVLAWLIHHVHERYGLVVHAGLPREMMLKSEALTMFLFRVAQEMLFNVVKHAGVEEAVLRARRLGRYVGLCVSDQGRGFDPRKLKDTTGFGLLSIRERTELLGGRMKIRSAERQGSTFYVVVPDGEELEDRGQKEG